MKQTGLRIRHALDGGKYRIPGTNYRGDGYDETSRTIYEFHGCVYHGCPKCYPHDRTTTTDPHTVQSMEELYVVTKKRETEIISLGYMYVALWEHEYHRKLKSNEEMKSFLDVQDRLNPREFLWRTNQWRAITPQCTTRRRNNKILRLYESVSIDK